MAYDNYKNITCEIVTSRIIPGILVGIIVLHTYAENLIKGGGINLVQKCTSLLEASISLKKA